jgi:hypothetical protein
MYLHVGNDTVIKISELVTVLDAKMLTASPGLQKFLDENKVIDLTEGNAKSIVVTTHHIYLSPIGSTALKRKSAKISTL